MNKKLLASVALVAVWSCSPGARADFGDGHDFGMVPGSGGGGSGSKPRQSQNLAYHARQDEVMAHQMQKVAQYIELWCIRNSRFPEPGDQTDAVIADLTAMNQNNPYQPQDISTPLGSPLQSLSSEGGSEMYGNTLSEDYDSDVQISRQINRYRLIRDDSMNRLQLAEYSKNPPDEWQAPAGTITIIGSNQGMVTVWGAGWNGRPIRDPLSGHTMIISVSWGINNQDSNSPNEDS